MSTKPPEKIANFDLIKQNPFFYNILNSIDALIYAADIKTFEIIFANKRFVEVFGDYSHKKCYELLQTDKSEPCADCIRKSEMNYEKLPENFTWENFNQKTGKWFRISNSLIEISDTRKARLEVLYDISDKKEFEKKIVKQNSDFDKIISAIPNIVWRAKVTADGKFFDMYISQAAEKLLKIPPETINGNWYKYFEYVHKQDIAAIYRAIKISAETCNPVDLKYRLIDSENNIVEVYSKGAVERIDKNMVETFGVTTDLTKLHIIEKELVLSEQKYKTLFDNSPFPIIVHQNNRIILFNNALKKYLKSGDDKILLQKSIYDFIHPKSKEVVAERLKKLSEQNQKLPNSEQTYITPSGKVLDFEVTSSSIEYEGQKAVLVILNDITEHRKNIKKLQELVATKDKFFSIIAHDLKNPFNQILGFSDLLISDIDSYDIKEIKKIVQYINVSANNGYKLLENLLTWSRAQTGALKFMPEKINITDIIAEETENLQSSARKKNIEIFFDSNLTKQIFAFADKEMIKSVVRNLLSNAVKFTFPGGKISIVTDTLSDKYKISISDTGIGIRTEILDKIFNIEDSFSTPGTDNEQGTGLGLALCKEFIEKNGGEISVESKIGKGSTFFFTLKKY